MLVPPYHVILLNNTKKLLTHATMWMDLKRVILSEKCQNPNDTYFMMQVIYHF